MAGITLEDVITEQAHAKMIAYDVKFVEAQGKAPTAAQDYLRPYIYTPPGIDTDRIQRVRFPIPMSAAELVAFKGRRRFRRNSTRFVEMTHTPLNDGEHEYYKTIAGDDWVGFNTGPARLDRLVKSWPSKNACRLLNTGESASCWDGGTFLSASKSSNPFRKGAPTYKSFWASTTLNTTNVARLRAEMGARVDFNGDNLGFSGTILFCDPTLFPTAESICLDERLVGGATNPAIKWKLKPEKWMHLTAGRWGLLHADAVEDYPVFGAIEGTPNLKILGEESSKFETTSHMGYSIIADLGVKLLRSEAISLAVEP